MALFEPQVRRRRTSRVDAATRALSVTAVENDFVDSVYEKLASVYDLTFGPTLHPGASAGHPADGHPGRRARARSRRGHRHQRRAVSARLRRHRHRFLGSMLEKARERVAAQGHPQRAAARDGRRRPASSPTTSFDIVYAPYLISVVPDPVAVAQRDAPRLPARRPHHHPESFPQPEPRSVARSSARSRRSPFTSASSRISICRRFWRRPSSKPVSIEKVNVPRIWSLVTCVK